MHEMEGINHWLDVLKEKASSGYAIALHIQYNAPKLLFQTYPVGWINHYEKNGYVLCDPAVLWGFQNHGTCRWSDLISMDERDVFIAARDYDMNYGFVASIEAKGKHSIAAFARPDREFSDAEITEIYEIVGMIHNEEVSAIKLSDKQRALLNELANGARIEDASETLGIPTVTLKAQLASTREQLGTRTTAEAVQRAADLGLLA